MNAAWMRQRLSRLRAALADWWSATEKRSDTPRLGRIGDEERKTLAGLQRGILTGVIRAVVRSKRGAVVVPTTIIVEASPDDYWTLHTNRAVVTKELREDMAEHFGCAPDFEFVLRESPQMRPGMPKVTCSNEPKTQQFEPVTQKITAQMDAIPNIPRFVLRGQGLEFPLKNTDVTIGRSARMVVQLRDDVVSSHHATLSVSGDTWSIEDHSRNGTFVNGERITGRVALKPGDVVEFASKKFSFDRN